MVTLQRSSLARLQLRFPQFPSLDGSGLGLASRELCEQPARWEGSAAAHTRRRRLASTLLGPRPPQVPSLVIRAPPRRGQLS